MADNDALEQDLRQLASAMSYPDAVDVSYRVRNAITTAPARQRFLGARVFHVAGAALGVFLIALSLVLVALPGAREAIADFLGISGIEIRVTESPRPKATPTDPATLDLGEPATLAEAREAAAHDLVVPNHPILGPPDRVYIDALPVPGTITFAYEASDALPKTLYDVGALFTQFRARLQAPLLKKVVTPGTTVVPVDVGDEAYWIAGEPHDLLFRVKGGGVVADRTRLASNTLIWESEGVTYRLESSLSKGKALAIARGID